MRSHCLVTPIIGLLPSVVLYVSVSVFHARSFANYPLFDHTVHTLCTGMCLSWEGTCHVYPSSSDIFISTPLSCYECVVIPFYCSSTCLVVSIWSNSWPLLLRWKRVACQSLIHNWVGFVDAYRSRFNAPLPSLYTFFCFVWRVASLF